MPSSKNPDLTALHKLMPSLHESDGVQHAVRTAQRHEGVATTQPRKREKALADYVLRLQSTFESDHDTLRSRSWEAAISALLIEPEAIADSYWRQHEQLTRDNGYGTTVLDNEQKSEIAQQIRDAQRTGIESWADYLEEAGEAYPTWFKIYAWDGMSRLGRFDTEKGRYHRRNKQTVAPYPQLSAPTLAKVYEAVHSRFIRDETPTDTQLAELIQTGNFNALYSKYLLETKTRLKTPEDPNDVLGTWQKYTLKDLKQLTHAAEGSQWCIAGEHMARAYLEDGDSFYFFHLQDAETNIQSETASASIRLNFLGNVAELSGLKDGGEQYLEDALVPTVMEKVRTLPGGERYLAAFEDKLQLIAMDRKYLKAEPFALEELEFIYEIPGRIEYLDTFSHDPRVEEFRQHKKDIQRSTLEEKYSAFDTSILLDMKPSHVLDNLTDLLYRCDDTQLVMAKLSSLDNIASAIPQLLKAHISIDAVVARLEDHTILSHLPDLLEEGAAIDIDQLVDRLGNDQIVYNLPQLIEAGADIDVNELIETLDSYLVADTTHELIAHGADIDVLVGRLAGIDIVYHLPVLLAAGAQINIDSLVAGLNDTQTATALPHLFEAGVKLDISELLLRLSSKDIGNNLTELLGIGIDVDIDRLVNRLGYDDLTAHLSQILTAGADIDKILRRLSSSDMARLLPKLLEAGANIDLDALTSRLGSYGIGTHLPELLAAGASVKLLLPRLNDYTVIPNLSVLRKAGVEIDVYGLVERLDTFTVVNHLPQLLEAGADINRIALMLGDLTDINKYRNVTEVLVRHGYNQRPTPEQ